MSVWCSSGHCRLPATVGAPREQGGAGGRSHQPDGAARTAQVLSGCVIRGMRALTKKDTMLFSSASANLYWRLHIVAEKW